MASRVGFKIRQKDQHDACVCNHGVTVRFGFNPCRLLPSFGDYLKYAFHYIFASHKPIENMAGNPALIQDEADRIKAEARANDPSPSLHRHLPLLSSVLDAMTNIWADFVRF